MTKTILIADDDPGILDAMMIMLEDAGYEVRTTSSGQEILNLKDTLPDLLLLDIWMSGMNGKDICMYLRAQKSTQHLPIIMISANKDTEKIAKDAGANDFLAKPFEMKELFKKINAILE